MGYRDPSAHAEMRATKAEGGWAVVSTEQAEIHHTSEITPFIEQRIWDEVDLPALELTTSRIHAHGALAAIELCYNGMNGPNFSAALRQWDRDIFLSPLFPTTPCRHAQ